MNEEEKTRYLSNVYLVIAADGDVDEDEQRLFGSIAREIQADHGVRWEATKLAVGGEVQRHVSDRWSDRIRNLEDMILAVYCDGQIDPSEKQLVVDYGKQLGIDQSQLNQIKQEAKRRHALRKKLEEETRQRLAGAAVPYGIDKRPMPQGVDLEQLLPERVGDFRRDPIPVPQDIYHAQIYADYRTEGFGIFMELGICKDPAIAQGGVKTAIAETDGEGEVLAQSVDTDPSYYKLFSERIAFLAWSRGDYYFSADAQSGKDRALDAFMEAFPF
jgi:uncharacterized tellurite resistance protein B-like protein